MQLAFLSIAQLNIVTLLIPLNLFQLQTLLNNIEGIQIFALDQPNIFSDISQIPAGRHEVLEDCLYYYLSEQANTKSGDMYALFLEAPVSPDQNFILTVNNIVVDQVHSV